MLKNLTQITLLFCFLALLGACGKLDIDPIEELTAENERDIANRIHELINGDSDYAVLDDENYGVAYTYVYNHLKNLTLNEQVIHRYDYNWNIFILDNDASHNAFVTPGGHIYFDSGLLKFLTSEAEFIALLSHSIAYADMGFAQQKLQDNFGLSLLLDLASGSNIDDENGELIDVLYNTPFSTDAVSQADNYMLSLVCTADYDINEFSNFLVRANNAEIQWLDIYNTGEGNIENRIALPAGYTCSNAGLVGANTYQTELLDNL